MTLAFDDVGKGRPVVLLHGFPLSRAMWRPQREALAQHCRLITPDLPGFGDSPAPATTVEAMADAVNDLLTRLNLTEPVVLGGLSMGGYVSFAFVRKYADRLSGLILADTKAEPDDEAARANRDKMIGFASTHPPSAVIEQMLPKLVAPGVKPEVKAELNRIGAAQKTPAILAALQALRNRRDSTPTLEKVLVPTLILCGKEDSLTPPAQSEKMAKGIAGAKLVLLDGAGHMANLEAAEAFNTAVREFVLGLGGPIV